MPRENEMSTQRRLLTPDRGGTQARMETRRSHSRSRSRQPARDSGSVRRTSCRERSGSRASGRRTSLRARELELERQRDRLRALEDDILRERSQHRHRDTERSAGREAAARDTRSRSPTFNYKDVQNFINFVKSQPPVTAGASLPSASISHKNILPDFDPSIKCQRTDIWLRKVNECATVYGWDERTTVHFALQKLQGLAKVWYESQNTILFSWSEWQKKLLNAFPCEQNYGQSLEDMLRRKSRFDEPLEVYYYEKLAMLNQCYISGKNAVDCLIHGLSDKTMRSSANALRCSQPDQLLKFLMSNQSQAITDQPNVRRMTPESNVSSNNSNASSLRKSNNRVPGQLYCYNCKEKGHLFLKCPKPLIKCAKCYRYGHKIENCMFKNDSLPNSTNKDESVQKNDAHINF
ncbi:uncharacterized protein LOC121739867 [Aricia agestis]|uniref:uncharacterized protein LOC121739867 n=1 Tax=Aricia agestis TaxID=91739 RepID=UPI001C2038C8|nr:uncharacterized protein LOC121739867 [Aricia agestis]XP_041988392.1 uncharacterized protein LOC121739867 [Aricia agestis]